MKYVQPKSVTWWSSVVPLLIGLSMVTEQWHGQAALVTILKSVVGDTSPYVLINGGLLGIGVRGAIGDAIIKFIQASNQNSIGG